MNSSPRSLLINLALALGAMLVVAVGLEIYLRVQHGRELRRIERKERHNQIYTMPSADPALIYTIRPNHLGSNSRGYLDNDYSHPKDAHTFRIVIIGDSVAQGWAVERDESFGKVLERELNARSGFVRYEVIVLARLGYSTSQELVLLDNEAFDYEPDLILWSYCLNDPAHPVYHNANGDLGRYYYKPASYLLDLIKRRWFLARERWRARHCPDEFHALLHCVYWTQVERDVQHIADTSAGRGVPCVFLIHPVFQEGRSFDEYTLRGIHERLSELATASGLIPIDLLEAVRPYDPNDIKAHWDGWYDPWHPNAKGHRIIAEYILKRLRELDLL